jgi:hypothetical protein
MKLTLFFALMAGIALASSSSVLKISVSVGDGEESEVRLLNLDESREEPEAIDEPLQTLGQLQDESQTPQDTESFDDFLTNFEIELTSTDSYGMRKKIFTENYQKIRDHNERFYRGLETFEMAVNQFTHQTEDEHMDFLSQVDPSDANNFSLPLYKMVFDDETEPAASVNWVERNMLQPITVRK